MANQPNAYKKFVASAATATLVASALVPAASAASVDGFTDVSKDYKEAVNYLLENGIAQGTTETTFGTGSNISRGDAAVMIANALNLDTANAKDQGFQDVNSRVEGAVNAIVEAGIASGRTNAKFDPAAYITRQEMAKMLANAYDLTATEKADFKDVNANWIDYVSALKEAGITLGKTETTFAPTANLTRGEFALFVYRAEVMPANDAVIVDEVTVVNETTTTAKLKVANKELTAKDFTVLVNGKEVTPSKVESNEAGDVYTITHASLKDTSGTVSVNGKQAAFNFVVVEAKVESVSAINAKTVEVKFNTPVEKSSVITGAAGSEKALAGAVTVTRTSANSADTDIVSNAGAAVDLNTFAAGSASLSEDGKTLTITADTDKFFQGNYDVKVAKAVKKGTTEVIENYYSKFTANDTAAPTVTDAKYNVATDKFEITLSKPVDALTDQVVRVNGQPVAAGFDAITAPTTKLTVQRPATVEPGTTAAIYVAGIKDAAGNLMTAYNGNVLVAQDTAALAVNSVEQIQNQKVRVTLNKKLDNTSNTNILAGTGLVVTKSDGSVTSNFSVAAAPANVNPDGNKYDITLLDATYTNGNTENFMITFVEDAFKGVSGTKNKVYTKNVTLTKDTVNPTVKSTQVAVDKESVEVTFDKAVTVTAAGNVKLRLNGAELSAVTAAVKTGTDNVVVVKTTDATAVTAGKLNAGTYQARFEAGAVTDLNGNTNATFNAPTVTVGDSSTVEPAKAVIADSGTNTFTVTAPAGEKFTTASLNYQNFVLDGQTIPANSDITFVDNTNKVITIKLPATNSVNIQGPALLKATGLTFDSGNPYATSSATVTVADNTPATLTASKVLGNTLELTFDEAIDPSTLADEAAVIADFTIKSDAGTFTVAGTPAPATATVAQGSNDKKIVITVVPANSNWSTVVGGTNLTVTTKEGSTAGKVTNLKDKNGVLVKSLVKVSVTK